ncbi:hypothetical protein D9757_003871 [Collybiopsis confluens]|uniref:NadR/Ttd14 AAA domain-containing protein n=1 Tax=Collybiopsis confluens TaxID=2823264 RepID=A0A8H5HV87_9AGAR|nr:hypothetical protein D9757_003871 [Collybiopsis confluens]
MTGLKAIYVVGPSSTGKTTLCHALATRLGLTSDVFITEVARTVMKDQNFTRADVNSLAMQQAIVTAQVSRDLGARKNLEASEHTSAHLVLLSDRSAVDALVYAALSELEPKSGITETLLSSKEFQGILPYYRSMSSTFVLLHPIPAWLVDDGVRSLEDGERCYDMFVTILKRLEIHFVEVGEDCRWIEERVAFVRRAALV